VSRILRLASLAPDLVEVILAGQTDQALSRLVRTCGHTQIAYTTSGVAVMGFRSATACATKLMSSFDWSPPRPHINAPQQWSRLSLDGLGHSADHVRIWLRLLKNSVEMMVAA